VNIKNFKKVFLLSLLTFSFFVPQKVEASNPWTSNRWTSPVVVGLEALLFGVGIGTSVFCYKKAKYYDKKLLFLKELAEGLGVDGVENLTKDLVLSDDAKKFSKERNQLEILNEVIKSIKDYDSVESFSEKISKKKLFGRLGMGGGVLLSVIGILGFIKSSVEIRKINKVKKICRKFGVKAFEDHECLIEELNEVKASKLHEIKYQKEEIIYLEKRIKRDSNLKKDSAMFKYYNKKINGDYKAGYIKLRKEELEKEKAKLEGYKEDVDSIEKVKSFFRELYD